MTNPMYCNDLAHMAEQSLSLMAGIDEAGRGALAGPVVIAAVALDYRFEILGINDSKKLSASCREELYERIIGTALDYQIVEIPASVIDEINILQATLKGFDQAYRAVCKTTNYALVDGRDLPPSVSGRAVVKGDTIHACIAAASILAKVHRDRLMKSYDLKYPEYDFGKHKGYGTQAHYHALGSYGASPLHRRSFRLS